MKREITYLEYLKNSISLNGQTILFGKLSISGNLKVVRDLEEFGEKMEDYNLLNSKLNYQLTDKTSINLECRKSFDGNYETAKGYSTSKRAFYLMVIMQNFNICIGKFIR